MQDDLGPYRHPTLSQLIHKTLFCGHAPATRQPEMFDPTPLVTIGLCGVAVSPTHVTPSVAHGVPLQLLNALHEFEFGTRRTIKFEEVRYKRHYAGLMMNMERLALSASKRLGFLTFREELFTQGQCVALFLRALFAHP